MGLRSANVLYPGDIAQARQRIQNGHYTLRPVPFFLPILIYPTCPGNHVHYRHVHGHMILVASSEVSLLGCLNVLIAHSKP
jgi:hypothetical protein